MLKFEQIPIHTLRQTSSKASLYLICIQIVLRAQLCYMPKMSSTPVFKMLKLEQTHRDKIKKITFLHMLTIN